MSEFPPRKVLLFPDLTTVSGYALAAHELDCEEVILASSG